MKEIRERGASTVEVTCNATDGESLRSLRDETADAFGSVDILVYVPSYVARQGVADATDDEWQKVFDVHLDGAYRAMQLFAPAMGDGGSVVHVASASAVGEIPDPAAYFAVKV